MALPIVPLALAAGAVALARNIHIKPVDIGAEDALDRLDEGLGISKSPDSSQINAGYRCIHEIRLGQAGPGVKIDLSLLGRLKLERLQ